jgi:hypothetical protein
VLFRRGNALKRRREVLLIFHELWSFSSLEAFHLEASKELLEAIKA